MSQATTSRRGAPQGAGGAVRAGLAGPIAASAAHGAPANSMFAL